MAGDDKKGKTEPAAKKADAPKDKGAPDAASSKPESAVKAEAAPASYSRGEGQKPSLRPTRTIGTRSLRRRRERRSVKRLAPDAARVTK